MMAISCFADSGQMNSNGSWQELLKVSLFMDTNTMTIVTV
jgi:hypothetical protein